MATSNTTKTTTNAAPLQREQPITKVFTTASAMGALWAKACDKLTTTELEWFANGAAEQVSHEAHNLSAVLESTGCLVQSDENETGSFQDSNSSSHLLFNLQSQLSTIAGLADIASEAGSLARKALKDAQAV
jgi:hypothetical protein